MSQVPQKPINDYILSCIDSEAYEVEARTEKEKLSFVLDCFNSEYNYPENKLRYPALQNRFAEWVAGLPSVFNIDFYNHKILELNKKWGRLPENATEKREDDILLSWWLFSAQRFFMLCEKYKVDYSHVA